MSEKKVKFDGSVEHRMAIMHLIGQVRGVFHKVVRMRDIAGWMNVSKPTAKRYLMTYFDSSEIIMTKFRRTKNSDMWSVNLTELAYREYMSGLYVTAYREYVQEVMGVILR